MSDLRREVRAAFDREQAFLHVQPGLAARLARTAASAPRRHHITLQVAAAVAVLALVTGLVGAAVVAKRSNHPQTVLEPTARPTALPTPIPSPTALQQDLAVSASTPVILVHDAQNFGQVDGITWDGHAGRVADLPRTDWSFTANPQGALYLYPGGVYDRGGRLVATLSQQTKERYSAETWSDDGTQLCSITSAPYPLPATGVPTTLTIGPPGGQARQVAQVGTLHEQTWVKVPVCSIRSDRALVVQSGGQGVGTAAFWMVQLSTGRVVWSKTYTLDGVHETDISASEDARYVSEVAWTFASNEPPSATIYTGAGNMAGHVAGRVNGFSSDGSLAVVSGPDNSVKLVRWSNGTVLWTSPEGSGYGDFRAEPGGTRIAIGVRNPARPQTSGFPPLDLYLLDGNGKQISIFEGVYL